MLQIVCKLRSKNSFDVNCIKKSFLFNVNVIWKPICVLDSKRASEQLIFSLFFSSSFPFSFLPFPFQKPQRRISPSCTPSFNQPLQLFFTPNSNPLPQLPLHFYLFTYLSTYPIPVRSDSVRSKNHIHSFIHTPFWPCPWLLALALALASVSMATCHIQFILKR